MNRQAKNVGNLGDILKHAALFHFCKALTNQIDGGGFIYVDSHSYLAKANLANAKWHQQTRRLGKRYSAYRDYHEAVIHWTRKRHYLCSSGMIQSAFSPRRMLLAEKSSSTRKRLRLQLNGFSKKSTQWIRIVHEQQPLAKQLRRVRLPLCVLHDPFRFRFDPWASLRAGLSFKTGLALLFHYAKNQRRVFWPPAPRGWKGPVAVQNHCPFFMAIYSSVELVPIVLRSSRRLGWHCREKVVA